MSETLKDLLEYLQNKIDSGEHKIFFNDLGWDVKTIDCINAINEQQEEIERLNKALQDIKEYCNNRLDYYNEMRRDYMKEFDGYAENDAENILDIVNKVIGSEE